MKFLRSIGLAALLMVGASSASAQVYYDMTQMTSQSGYRSEIYETVTTADFLRAPANGVQRLAFTRGSAFTATVYACETKTYAAATCTSVATLSATDPSILVTTGRAWLVVDVTAAETAGNVSYLTIRSHSTQQLSGGGSSSDQSDFLIGGVAGVVDANSPNDANGNGTYDDPIICTRATNDCLYLSSTSGLWSAVSGDGSTTTRWSVTQETILWYGSFEGAAAAFATAAYSVTADCAPVRQANEITTIGACANNQFHFRHYRPMFITRMCGSSSQTLSTTEAAGIRLAHSDGATTLGTLNIPASDVIQQPLVPECVVVNTLVASSVEMNLIVGQGAFCAGGAPCVWQAGVSDVQVDVLGYFL